MPIYEYECSSCEEVTEALQKFSDTPLKKCPHCGGKLHKIMSLNAFQLKGDGWYVTDYKGKNASNRPSGDSGAEKAEKIRKDREERQAQGQKGRVHGLD